MPRKNLGDHVRRNPYVALMRRKHHCNFFKRVLRHVLFKQGDIQLEKTF